MRLSDLVKSVTERWLTVAGCVIAALAVTTVITLLSPTLYSSTTTMYVSTDNSTGNAGTAYQGSLLSEQRVKSYLELTTSRRIAGAVSQDLGGLRSPDELLSAVSVTSSPDTVVLSIVAVDRSPEVAAQVANGFARYLSIVVAEIEQPADRRLPPAVSAKVVEAATANISPVFPRVVLNFALGLLIGLLIGIALAVARDMLDRSVKSVSELEKISGAAVLSSLPIETSLRNRSPLVVSQSKAGGPFGEALRQLRTNLEYLNVDDPPRKLVVSSATPGEGKSTTVCALAVALAEAGRRVIIVDADLRRPQIAQLFGLESSVGVSNVLSGRVRCRDAIQHVDRGRVALLASGPVPPNPSELVGSRAMAELLESLSLDFDLVVVDAPPLLPVADAASLATKADGVVLLCRHGVTESNDVAEAVRSLHAVSAVLLGTVMTMAPAAKKGSYGYGSYVSDVVGGSRPGKEEQATADEDEAGRTRPTPRPRV